MVEATVDVFMTHVSFESFRAVMSFVDTHEKSKAKSITFSYTLHRSITKNKLQNFFCLKQNTEDSKQQKNTSSTQLKTILYEVHEIFLSSNVCNIVCNPEESNLLDVILNKVRSRFSWNMLGILDQDIRMNLQINFRHFQHNYLF